MRRASATVPSVVDAPAIPFELAEERD